MNKSRVYLVKRLADKESIKVPDYDETTLLKPKLPIKQKMRKDEDGEILRRSIIGDSSNFEYSKE